MTPPPTGAYSGNSGGGGEKGSLKERMVRARGQLDELVEQTAEQFRKMTVGPVVLSVLSVLGGLFFLVCFVCLFFLVLSVLFVCLLTVCLSCLSVCRCVCLACLPLSVLSFSLFV